MGEKIFPQRENNHEREKTGHRDSNKIKRTAFGQLEFRLHAFCTIYTCYSHLIETFLPS